MEKSKHVFTVNDIKNYYNSKMKDISGDYIHYRWHNSDIQKRHYCQTEKALKYVLSKINFLGSVLEIGCGPAVWTKLYMNRCNDLVLLDISEKMLGFAKEKMNKYNNIKYICSDFEGYNTFKDNQFNAIISVRAFEYMQNKEEIVKKCYRLLSDNGILIIITKNKEWMDHKSDMKITSMMEKKDLSMSQIIQTDLIGVEDMINLSNIAGFRNINIYPVVVGSYMSIFKYKPGLYFMDIIHKYVFKRKVGNLFSNITESIMLVAKKTIE